MKAKITQPNQSRPRRKRRPSDKEQYERFREFAREHGTDDDAAAFDRKFRKIVPPKIPGGS